MRSLVYVLCVVMFETTTSSALGMSAFENILQTSPQSTLQTLASSSPIILKGPPLPRSYHTYFPLNLPSSLSLTETYDSIATYQSTPWPISSYQGPTSESFLLPSTKLLSSSSGRPSPPLQALSEKYPEFIQAPGMSSTFTPGSRSSGLLPSSKTSYLPISSRSSDLLPSSKPSDLPPGLLPPGRLSQIAIGEATQLQIRQYLALPSPLLLRSSKNSIQERPAFSQHRCTSDLLQRIYKSPRSTNLKKLMCMDQQSLSLNSSGQLMRTNLGDFSRNRNGSITNGRKKVRVRSFFPRKALVNSHSIDSMTKNVKLHVPEALQLVNVSSSSSPTIWITPDSERIHSDPCQSETLCQEGPDCLKMTELICDKNNPYIEFSWNRNNASFTVPEEHGDLKNISFSPCLDENNTSIMEISECFPTETSHTPDAASLVASEWARIVGFSLIFVVGVVGNVLVVVTLLHHRNLRTVTNVFLLNLAVSDLLLGVFCMPFTLVGSLLQDFVFGTLMCRLIPYMQVLMALISPFKFSRSRLRSGLRSDDSLCSSHRFSCVHIHFCPTAPLPLPPPPPPLPLPPPPLPLPPPPLLT
ncbi:uncharacterized protein [Cherax quadricarinatus]|uniref:uncharacterized protein n=1 Tax=Cherax quadricarinatus TaxID=27406 RepID=UPI00387E56B3